MSKEVTNSAKYQERFEKELQNVLVPENTFWLNTRIVSDNSAAAHIPQYLGEITGPSSFTKGPLTKIQKSQTNKTVTKKTYQTNAYVINNIEATFVSNDQRKDLVFQMKAWMDTVVGNAACYNMAPATSTLFTSGTATRSSSLFGSGSVVKKAVLEDWIKIKTEISKTNIPGGQWFCLIDADMLGDLLSISEFVDADKSGLATSALMNGEIAKILGINFKVRHASLGANVAYTSSGTLADVYDARQTGTPDAVTGLVSAAIFWNSGAVITAIDPSVETYVNTRDAVEQGDVFSMSYSFGSMPIRTDNVGVIALVEKK